MLIIDNKDNILLLLEGMINTDVIRFGNIDECYKDMSYNEWCIIYNNFYKNYLDSYIQNLK